MRLALLAKILFSLQAAFADNDLRRGFGAAGYHFATFGFALWGVTIRELRGQFTTAGRTYLLQYLLRVLAGQLLTTRGAGVARGTTAKNIAQTHGATSYRAAQAANAAQTPGKTGAHSDRVIRQLVPAEIFTQ